MKVELSPDLAVLRQSFEEKHAALIATMQQKLPNAYFEASAKQIAEIEALYIVENALKVGERAPDFELPDAYGEPVRLSELLEAGPVVLTFYRGSWCPFCNLTLKSLQAALPYFRNLKANLVAISPMLPDNTLDFVEKQGFSFDILSDVGLKVAEKYRLVYKLTDEMIYFQREVFKDDLLHYNGENSWKLPLAATYVIDTDGIIRFSFPKANAALRPEPSHIIETLLAIRK
jgi:peroxiredoxin